MAKYRVVFFLEDAAQEAFIYTLVERLIVDEGKNAADYELLVLSSRGGGSIRAYKDFIKQAKKHENLRADVLIVGSDANCHGFVKRSKQLSEAAKDMPYLLVITAIPDPHIEKWYLLDSQALARAAGVSINAVSPAVKCNKNHYKNLLKTAFADQSLFPPLGGAEYGPLVAKTMDLYHASTADRSFRDFVNQVRFWLRQQ